MRDFNWTFTAPLLKNGKNCVFSRRRVSIYFFFWGYTKTLQETIENLESRTSFKSKSNEDLLHRLKLFEHQLAGLQSQLRFKTVENENLAKNLETFKNLVMDGKAEHFRQVQEDQM